MITSKTVLVAPLNWGLGHSTRCMPIIRALQKQGAKVILASDGRALDLLKKEFPELPAVSLPAYNIRYSTDNMFFNIAYQLPKIIYAIWKEKQAVTKLVSEYQIDAIISDNRFGCVHKNVYSIFITHQLRIKMPIKWLESFIEKFNHYFIKKFDECWVPDVEGKPNLSGILAHGSTFETPNFIGVLSRMEYEATAKKYDAIAVLSGPEPQRTVLEKKIIGQLEKLDGNYLVVQGKTESFADFVVQERIRIISYMTGKMLNEAMLASGLVISRSGYSTVMDLAKLGKKAILIPTPGQTEQEYLANYFYELGIFYFQNQNKLDLAEAIQKVRGFSGLDRGRFGKNILQEKVDAFLRKI